MRRWTLRICVLLVLGAIINVAVAWGFEMTRTWHWPYKRILVNLVASDSSVLSFESRERVGDATVYWQIEMDGLQAIDRSFIAELLEEKMQMHLIQYRGYGPVEVGDPYQWLPPPVNKQSPERSYSRCNAYGWPVLTLIYLDSAQVKPSGQASRLQSGWQVRDGGGNPIKRLVLPLRPLWPGFAINTVFYAAVLWFLFAFPFALRKRRRIKRGWCPKCAYDLRGRRADAAACPECGAAVPLSLGGPG